MSHATRVSLVTLLCSHVTQVSSIHTAAIPASDKLKSIAKPKQPKLPKLWQSKRSYETDGDTDESIGQITLVAKLELDRQINVQPLANVSLLTNLFKLF